MTVEFLHFWGTPEDTEEALRRWLRQRIREATANDPQVSEAPSNRRAA
jgi:hypothetical protein